MKQVDDKKKKEEKIWVDTHTLYKDRKCGSGLTFSGVYKNKNSN